MNAAWLAVLALSAVLLAFIIKEALMLVLVGLFGGRGGARCGGTCGVSGSEVTGGSDDEECCAEDTCSCQQFNSVKQKQDWEIG